MTQAENNRRSYERNPRPRATRCRRGHEMTAENTYVSRGDRQCRACHHAWYFANKEKRSA